MADTKISAMTAVVTPAGTDEIPVVQGGLNKKETVAQIISVHEADSTAHTAATITADSTTLVGTGTDVQAVLEELDNGIADHLADTTAAHAASAISVDSTTLSGVGTDLQAVLEELDDAGGGASAVDDLTDVVITGVADNEVLTWDSGTNKWVNQAPATGGAVAAADVTVVSTTLVGTGADAQAVFEELDNAIVAAETATSDHLSDTTAAHAASAISILDTASDFTATNVEDALAELQTDLESIPSIAAGSYVTAVTTGSPPTEVTTIDLTSAFAAKVNNLLEFSPENFRTYSEPMFDDFLGSSVTSGTIGKYGWSLATVGTGALAAPASDLTEPGFRSLDTNAINDSTHLWLNDFYMTGSPEWIWEARVRRGSGAASAANDAKNRCGVVNTAIADATDGAWFETSYNGGDLSWHARSRNAGGTIEDTDTAVDIANSWQRLRITCSGSGTYLFYIDSTLVATHTTVADAAAVTGPVFGQFRVSAAATVRNLRVGYCYFRYAITR